MLDGKRNDSLLNSKDLRSTVNASVALIHKLDKFHVPVVIPVLLPSQTFSLLPRRSGYLFVDRFSNNKFFQKTARFITGYEFDHPFLDKSCGITKSGKYVLPLYQHVVNIMHPSMMFIGVSKKVINRVFDAQVFRMDFLVSVLF